ESSPVFGRDPAELRRLVRGDGPDERMLDAALRAGAYGDGFGAVPGGLSLERLIEHPHGVDLGPLEPRVPEVLRTPSGRIELCPPQVHPDGAARLGVAAGASASVTSRVGCVEALVEVTAEVAPGVVSLPHGWGHDAPGARLRTAAARPGVNSNLLSDDAAVD